MTGPEHLLEGERLLAAATNADHDASDASVSLVLQFAGAHFAAATASAAAVPAATTPVRGNTPADWREALVSTWEDRRCRTTT